MCLGPTHREEVTERYMREDLVGSVLGTLPPAFSPLAGVKVDLQPLKVFDVLPPLAS